MIYFTSSSGEMNRVSPSGTPLLWLSIVEEYNKVHSIEEPILFAVCSGNDEIARNKFKGKVKSHGRVTVLVRNYGSGIFVKTGGIRSKPAVLDFLNSNSMNDVPKITDVNVRQLTKRKSLLTLAFTSSASNSVKSLMLSVLEQAHVGGVQKVFHYSFINSGKRSLFIFKNKKKHLSKQRQ